VKNTGKIKGALFEALKGLLTGSAMLIPGVSGGTMALVFGFYDRLVDAASNIFKDIKKNFKTLLFYLVFIGLGFVAFSGAMSWLIGKAPLPVFALFTGAVLGGFPVIYGKARASAVKPVDIIYPVIGVAVIVLLSLIPEDLLAMDGERGALWYVIMLAAGIFLAAALILPGISFSHMMLALGLYEPFTAAIKELDVLYLLPIALSVLIGVFLVVKLLDKLMKKYPKQTFLTVLGFVMASAGELLIDSVIPLVGSFLGALMALLFAAIGFAAVFFISKQGD